MSEDQKEIKQALSAKQTPEEIPQNEQLQLAAQELKEKPTNPEAVTLFWRTFINDITRRVGIDPIEVPPVDRTAEKLEQLQKEGRIMVYNPAISYALLEKAFPDMKIVNGDKNAPDKDLIEDMADFGRFGYFGDLGNRAEGSDLEYLVDKQARWIDIGVEPEAVLSKWSAYKERDFFENSQQSKHRRARLSTYMLGSQENRLVTGHFLSFSDAIMGKTHYKWKNYATVAADFKPNGEIIIKRDHVSVFAENAPDWAR